MICSPDKLVLTKPITGDITLEEIARLLGEDYDIILTEGFTQGDAPKIEVHRQEAGPSPTTTKKLFAIATDEPLPTKTRQFSLDDIKGLADLLELGFIKPQRERVLLYVNNVPVSLSRFPRQIISNTILALVSSLKGVKKVKSLDIFLRKSP
jgi:hypothetical protein